MVRRQVIIDVEPGWLDLVLSNRFTLSACFC
jgi:hypothetical protein